MPSETVTLALNSGTDIGLAEFVEAVGLFDRLLSALSRKHAGKGASGIAWDFGGVSEGSAILSVSSEHAKAPAVADAYLEIGQTMARGETLPYGARIRKPAEKMVAMLANGVREIRFETRMGEAVIGKDERTGKPVAVPLRAALGAVEGTVEVLSRRRGLHFNLYDALFDRPVLCYVDSEQADRMRDIWGKRVIVEGLVTRDAEHGYPLAVRRITRIENVPDVAPGSYRKALGAIPRQPGQPRAEEVIRKMRDAV